MSAVVWASRTPVRVRNEWGTVAAAAVVVVIAVAVLAPGVLTPLDPLATDPVNAFAAPHPAHLLGTDQLGRDVLSRVIHGARHSVIVGLGATAIAVTVGSVLGLIAGLSRGPLENLLSRGFEVIGAFPEILLALLLIAFTGPGTTNLILALGIAGIPSLARVVRAQTMVVSSAHFVEQARTFGMPPVLRAARHILPHAIAPIPVLATIGLGGAILGAAALSFLGLGPQPPDPEWGAMLAEGRRYLGNAWWIAVFPGAVVTVLVISVTTLGRRWQRAFEGRDR